MTIATLFFALLTVPTTLGGSGEPIILDFTASWCGPCKQMRPVVEQLVEKGYPIKPVDIDQAQDLAERYQVTAVPAFIVIDPTNGRVLGRTEGFQPASELANLYIQARARYRSQSSPSPRDDEDKTTDDADAADRERERQPVATASPNPKPWETVVRIKVHGNGAIGFGSGTVIYSTPEESLILTCAHIFKLENGPTPPPSRFPRKITIDLFDGNLSGPKRNQVHYANETVAGEAVDYDFNLDVGLIRIRPGRRLPHARVVPAHWKPQANMGVITVGCSEGQDATAWNTVIVNPRMKGLNGNHVYEAIECRVAPKQGRSGGGLFTSDGYVAGVCDFAEPQGDHGLYAAPSSIYKVLNRNDLMALYAPVRNRPQTVLAKNRSVRGQEPEYRMQSPDRNDPGSVTLPPPAMLGIKTPVVTENENENENEPGRSRTHSTRISQRNTWHPTRTAALKMDPSAVSDQFDQVEPIREAQAPADQETRTVRRPASGGWRVVREPLPELSASGAQSSMADER